MLTLLHIENIAVVEQADIELEGGFSVLTGETGAGKSILIGAINAVLGVRTSRELIRTGAKSAFVSAVFHALSDEALGWLSDNGYAPDEDGSLLIQREITAEGKNLCKVGGRPITVALLRELGSLLVNIHGQHDSQQLLDEAYHLSYLDRFGTLETEAERYREAYRALQSLRREMDRLTVSDEEKAKRLDILRYQIDEIAAAELQPDEEAELEARRNVLRHAEQIREAVELCYEAIYGSDDAEGACGLASVAEQAIRSVAEMDEQLGATAKLISEARYALEDCAERVRDMREEYGASPEELDLVEQRLALIHQLGRKYGAGVPEILATLERYQTELDEITFSEQALERAQAEYDKQARVVDGLAASLTAQRMASAERLSARIQEELRQLDMKQVRFTVQLEPLERPGSDGAEHVRFLISANPGEPPRPIAKIASGGELARIMLSMKSVLVSSDSVETLIFDEVDAGVSGRAAQRVAEKMSGIAALRQVICITHLPQIAAMADHHFLIEKRESGGRTFTSVTPLDPAGRRQELARIIGGAQITETTLKTAAELIEQARGRK